MVVIVPGCGLCNRMRAIASAYTLAQRYNHKLVVMWNMNEELNCKFGELLTIKNGTVINCRLREGKRNWSLIISKKLCQKTFLNVTRDNVEEICNCLKAGTSVFLTSIYQFEDVDEYTMFEPSKKVSAKAKEIMEQNLQWENIIGVHVRRTDNPWSVKHSKNEAFIEAMQSAINNDPNVSFYLSTDAKDVEETLKSEFGNRVVTQGEKDLSRDSKDGMIAAAVDLYCLSQTKRIIGSFVSSFSDTASLWGGKKPIDIIDDQKLSDRSILKYHYMR